jgi:cytochrome c biogenesis protein CcmG, thiol:disulfide interchange protein DsbE
VAAAALLALVGVSLFAALSSSTTNVSHPLVEQTNEPAPNFSLPELLTPARTLSLADFRGKPLVVNFWASWCFPCETEMPLLESTYRSVHGTVQFVGIDTGDTRGAAIHFLRQVHVTYPMLSLGDLHGRVVSAYGLPGLPSTIFISSSGKIVGKHFGQFDRATLQAALKVAFG